MREDAANLAFSLQAAYAAPLMPRCGTTGLMPRLAALFRGINVGRNRRVSMADIRDVLVEHYDDVRTHGQSGNVVFSTKKSGKALERELERLMVEELGLETRILVRTSAELGRIVKKNPIAEAAKNPSRYLVTFLADKPEAAKLKALRGDFGSEHAIIHGKEVYSWHPDGLQRSKLASLIADGLGTVGTARNWNTVEKLHDLTSD
jgi:uncharacterized protein (DUF1697 family)